VAGKGVAQHVRRQTGGINTGSGRQLLEQLGQAAAGQVPGRATRGK
jgi:hypothetical protein